MSTTSATLHTQASHGSQQSQPNSHGSCQKTAKNVQKVIVENGDCGICFDPISPEDRGIEAHGGDNSHIYHERCISEWSKGNPLLRKKTCPGCRDGLDKEALAIIDPNALFELQPEAGVRIIPRSLASIREQITPLLKSPELAHHRTLARIQYLLSEYMIGRNTMSNSDELARLEQAHPKDFERIRARIASFSQRMRQEGTCFRKEAEFIHLLLEDRPEDDEMIDRLEQTDPLAPVRQQPARPAPAEQPVEPDDGLGARLQRRLQAEREKNQARLEALPAAQPPISETRRARVADRAARHAAIEQQRLDQAAEQRAARLQQQALRPAPAQPQAEPAAVQPVDNAPAQQVREPANVNGVENQQSEKKKKVIAWICATVVLMGICCYFVLNGIFPAWTLALPILIPYLVHVLYSGINHYIRRQREDEPNDLT
jgi:hypothetical protein